MVGIISFICRMWSKVLNVVRPNVKPKTWSYIVYSEDTCRIDEDGGPYIVEIRND